MKVDRRAIVSRWSQRNMMKHVLSSSTCVSAFLKIFTTFIVITYSATFDTIKKLKTFTMKGALFVFLWYSSIFWSVFFIYCPLIPLMFINRRLFRKLMDIILACWETYPAVLLELLIGTRVYISGDYIRPEEGSILLMNHRNRLDWFFLWACLLHGVKPAAHRAKFVLKSDVRVIPGIGWGLQLAGFLFIHRNWTKDETLLKRSLNYFKDLGNKYQILIFAEGTDLTDESRAKSNSFAQKNGLEPYEYVLHPRTTGFTFLVQQMQKNEQLDAVYDMTIAYPKTLPETEIHILQGKFPEEVHFQITRYESKNLPNDEPHLKKWCEDRWAEKEKALEKFYTGKGIEGEGDGDGKRGRKAFSSDATCEAPSNSMYMSLFVWTAFTFGAKYLFFTSTLAFYWVILCALIFILVSKYTDGIQQLEIALHDSYGTSGSKNSQSNNGSFYSTCNNTSKQVQNHSLYTKGANDSGNDNENNLRHYITNRDISTDKTK